jgi:hypothetical protein
MDEPNSPLDAYTALIDQLVSETRVLGSGHRVAQSGTYSNAPAHRDYNRFIQSLSPEQRELLARMLQEERDSTIHDVLAVLSWWIEAREVGLTFRGKSMPVDLSGMGLHGDYVGRRDGWDWPTGDKPGRV